MTLSSQVRYYVFVDRETCAEKNYPRYGYGLQANSDSQYGRGRDDLSLITLMYPFISEYFHSKFYNISSATFVLAHCDGGGRTEDLSKARDDDINDQIAFLPISGTNAQSRPQDQGLLPPAPHPYTLSQKERNDIFSCKSEDERPILVSFSGAVKISKARNDLASLSSNDGRVVIFRNRKRRREITRFTKSLDSVQAFHRLAQMSMFAAAPRGDNLFSYRLTELCSVGAIPVIYADDWKLPFDKELFDWNDIAVIIPEANVSNSIEILSNITREQRCQMRRRLVEIYDKYMVSGQHVMDGIIETFELKAKQAKP